MSQANTDDTGESPAEQPSEQSSEKSTEQSSEQPSKQSSDEQPPRSGSGTPLVAVALAVILGLVAIGLSAWALLRPSGETSTTSTTYTDAQRAEAKTKVCTAYDNVRKGVTINTNLRPPGGEADVVGAYAVAANARIALYDGGQYLLAKVEPATPQDLAEPVRKFGNLLLDIGAAATAGAQNSDPAQAARLKEADSINGTITELCK